jgi:oligoendopeptidase F
MTTAPQTIDAATLPTWNLADLYPGPDSKELADDIARMKPDAVTFRENYQGKLSGADAKVLAAALADYEAMADRMGRIGAFGFLYYVGDQQDGARRKLFGDIQGKLTEASSELIFFELELNQIADAALETALNDPVLADHQHAGQGQGNLRPLARLRGRGRSRHLANRVEARWSMRWWKRCARPTRSCRTAITR